MGHMRPRVGAECWYPEEGVFPQAVAVAGRPKVVVHSPEEPYMLVYFTFASWGEWAWGSQRPEP